MKLSSSQEHAKAPESSKIVFVPQGRCARIDKNAAHGSELSLYTDGISNCNIVTIIGEERASLIHVDGVFNLETLGQELAWVGKGATVEIRYRLEFDGAPLINHSLVGFFKQLGITVKNQNIPLDRDGIQITLKPNTEVIILHPKRSVPENLSRHPDEQKFTTALKIDQLFTVTMADRPNKKKLIYDGQCWQKIPES